MIYVPSAQMMADMPRYEGMSLSVYDDGRGNATQGIGRHDGVRFGDPDITELQMWSWLDDDLQKHYAGALELFPGLAALDVVRREALIQLHFNLGHGGLALFVPFVAHVNACEWDEAAFHVMVNLHRHITPYLVEVGARAVETALRLCSGNVLAEHAV